MVTKSPKVNPLDQLGDELAGLRADVQGVITRLPPVAAPTAAAEQNPPLSDQAQEELKAAWDAGLVSDETMDELDPDGLIAGDGDDD